MWFVSPPSVMRALVIACAFWVGCSSSAKDKEADVLRAKLIETEDKLANAEARLAEIDAQRVATVPVDASVPPTPVDDATAARVAKLRILSGYFESKVVKLSHELHISIEDTLDEYGRVSDPVKLCNQIRAGYVDRYGSDGAQVPMVRAFGSELGTQVFRGTLCEGPPVARGLMPPPIADLTSAFSDRILRDTAGWSKRLDISLDNLIDENGHVKDIGAVAHREHERLDQKSNDWERAISLFGNELGSAIHFDRIGQ
jgi:hypothetical protein